MSQDQKMKPLFIGGCPRSGTTLLWAMLGAHSQIVTTPESQFKIDLYFSSVAKRSDINGLLDLLCQSYRFKHWDVQLLNRSEIVKKAEGSLQNLVMLLVEEYNKKSQNKPSIKYWVDHTPSNIQHTHHLNTHYNEAKFIHLVRDGRAVAASIIPLDWGPNTVIGSAHYWIENLAFGLAAEKKLGPDKILTVHFENLVLRTEETLNTICKFMDLPFEEKLLSGNGFVPPGYTLGQHGLIGQLPDKSSIDRWRKHLSGRQTRQFESIAGDLLHYSGYQRYYTDENYYPQIIERITTEILEFVISHIFNHVKKYLRRKKNS